MSSRFFLSEVSPLKVTKEKAAENRAALVQRPGACSGAGIDGVGVAEISKKAGLTHGALYAQFPSKEVLAAEGFTSALKEGWEQMTAGRDGRPATLTDYLNWYLSFDHRDNFGNGCPMSASASEVARQDKILSERFTEGFEQLVAVMDVGRALSVKAEKSSACPGDGGRDDRWASPPRARSPRRTPSYRISSCGRSDGFVARSAEEGQVDGPLGRARATRKRARGARSPAPSTQL